MRRTSAVSMKSGSRSTATDAAEAATAAHRPPRIGRTPSAIPAFAADRYALEWCERRARSGISVSCSRLGRSRNSEMRSSVPSSASLANTTSSSTSTSAVSVAADSSLLTTVAFAFGFASATTCAALLPDLAGLAPASTVELAAAGFFAFPATAATSDLAPVLGGFTALAPVLETLAGLVESAPLALAPAAAAAALSGFGTLALSAFSALGTLGALETLAMAASPPAAALPAGFLVVPFAAAAAADSGFLALATLVWFLEAASPASSFFLVFPAAAVLAGLAAGTSSPSSSASSALRPPETLGLGFGFPGSAEEQSATWEQRSASSRSSTSTGRRGEGAIFAFGQAQAGRRRGLWG
ncbi:hypothetical protein BDA96_01G569400 [Sorghum bicolor]|uniref:Uncharacterized protein n=1 Tax=Sorghum bicolor TaxID=4558 RepID=A0A921S7W9_SORBI|nr:hypothetical protein BDA96_01G569400 [Sorghum bicolor]